MKTLIVAKKKTLASGAFLLETLTLAIFSSDSLLDKVNESSESGVVGLVSLSSSDDDGGGGG